MPNLLQLMMVAALLVSGMGVALLGSIKVPLAQKLAIDEARVGGLVSLFGFIMIPVILSAGFLTDHFSKQLLMISGSILLGLSLVLLALSRSYLLALLGVVLMSAAWSLLINVGNVLTPIAFRSDTDSMSYSTNLANFFFGLGAFLTPLAVAFLVRRTALSWALVFLAGLTLLPAVLTLGVDNASLVSQAAAGRGGQATSLLDPILWLCGLALLFYGPLEASMAAWTTTYLGDKGIRPGPASLFLSAFWLAFMASRLATAFWLTSWAAHLADALGFAAGAERVLIVGLALASVVVMFGIVLTRSGTMAVAMVVAAGLIFGPIFPTIMAILLGHFHASVHGRAVGVLFAIGGIGWTVIPMLIGAYARRTSVQRGFAIAVGAAVGLSLIALLLATW